MATRTVSATGGNWSATGTWVEGAVPTAADDVVCQVAGLSGNLTLDTTGNCRSVDFTNYTNNFSMNANQTLNVGTSTVNGTTAFKLVAGMLFTGLTTSTLNFVSTSATVIDLTSAALTLPCAVTFNGAGGSWRLADAHTINGVVTLTAGTLNTNAKAVLSSTFSSSNANTRTLNQSGTTWTVNGINGTVWDFTTNTNLTWTTTIATAIIASGSGVAATPCIVNTGGKSSSGDITMSGAGVVRLASTPTMRNFTRTGTTAKTDTFISSSFTCTGTFTCNGNSTTNRVLCQSNTIGTASTITAATVTVTNTDFRDITGAGAGSWNLAAITGNSGDCGGNTSITFTTAAPQTFQGTVSASWSTLATWTSRVPLPQDNVSVASAFSAAQTITADMPRLGANIDFTGTTGNVVWAWTSAITLYGSLTLVAAQNTPTSGGTSIIFEGRGSHTIRTHGISIPGGGTGVAIQGFGGTYTVQDNWTMNASWQLINGTFDANGFNMTAFAFNSSNTTTRTLTMGTGTWTATTTSTATAFNFTSVTGLTFSGSNAPLVISGIGSGTRTFATGGLTFFTLTYTVAGSTGPLVITGAGTFAAITFSDASNARTLTLPASTTTTATVFTVAGTTGKLMTVNSSTPGTAATISSISPHVAFVTFTDITATPTAQQWDDSNGGTDGGGNTNINFANLDHQHLVGVS